jgi:hypothetical protein
MAVAGDLATLIDDAAGSAVAVDELLRRLKVVATRARIPELEAWVQKELDGYEDSTELPSYRGPFPAHVLGYFSGMFGSHASNVPIAPSAFPAEYREGRLFEVRFFDGVAELETLAAATSELQIPWPADALILVQHLVGKGQINLNGNVLQEAHQVISRSSVVGILRTVRDRVLALALRLEQENPHLGETGVQPASPAVGRDVHIIVNGGQPNIAVASHNFTQSVAVPPGDRGFLVSRLKEVGVADADLAELEEALDADEAGVAPKPGPGTRVLGWLGQLTLKAGSAAGDSLAHQAGEAVGQFFS